MKTFYENERYTEQRESILDLLGDNNGRATWGQLRTLSMSPATLSEHISRLEKAGKVARDDAEQNGQIVSTFYLRRRQ